MITFLIICLVLYLIFSPKEKLEKKFEKLGNVEGLPYDAIVKQIGQPTSTSYTSTSFICTWSRIGGYSITLLFDKRTNRCVRLSNKTKVF